VPAPIVVWVVVLILAWLLLTQTRFGLHIYAIGGNEETTRLAGVSVNRVKVMTYGLSGLLAGVAGLLLTARVYSAQPQAGVALELDAIAASVLGGVSLFGGVGNVLSAVVGALIVGVLGNGMNLLRVASYPQQVIQGVVLVLAVTVDMYTKRFEK
jgi:ribose transport system permease protein